MSAAVHHKPPTSYAPFATEHQRRVDTYGTEIQTTTPRSPLARELLTRKLDDLARDLGIDDETEFGEAIEQLAEEGDIDISDSGLITLPSVGAQGGEIEGTFKRNPKGFGFVQTDDPMHEGDLFIPPEMTAGALTGDRVRGPRAA